MKTLYNTYNNFAKRITSVLFFLTVLTSAWAATGTLSSISTRNGSASDSQGNTWSIASVGATSSTAHGEYFQIGSSSNPATSITLTMTFPTAQKVTAFSAKFSGYSSEAKITLEVGNTVVGEGALTTSHSTSSPVTINSTSVAVGNTLTVSVTNIQNGVNFHNISYTYESATTQEVTWIVDGKEETANIPEGAIEVNRLPDDPDNCSTDIVFVGWTPNPSVDGSKPADLFNSKTPAEKLPIISASNKTFHAVYATQIEDASEDIDVITRTTTGVTGNSYDNWSGKTVVSDAIYAGYTAGGNSSIQLNDKNQGIITTASGGKVKKVVVEWNTSTTNGRTLNIYGSNKKYDAVSDLFDVNKQGTLLGSIVKGTSTELTITGDYEFIGLCSSASAMYLTSVSITWESEGRFENYTTTCSVDVTVTLNPKGGTGDFTEDWTPDGSKYTQTVEKGNSVTLPKLDDQIAYTFEGWSDGKTTHEAGSYTPEEDVELIAVWEAKPLTNYRTLCTYEIILDKNGGTTDGSALVTASKTALTAINPPVYAGHQIAGYYYEPECNTLVADVEGNLQPNTPYTNANRGWTAGEVTLYPKWEALEYTVTWVVGGDKDKPFATTTASATTPLVLPDPAPTNDVLGCCADAFIGWSTKTNPTKAEVFNDVANAPEITGNQTFHAVFATTTLTEGSATATFNEMGYTNAEKVTEIALGDGEGHGDATILFAKDQSASNYPAYYSASGALHAYAKNTITINSTSATSTITNVQFTFAAKEDGSNTISANVGTYADGTWSGSAESVVFTIGGETGHRKITSITVTTQAVEQYTNYVTKCTYGNSPTLGAATVTYNSGDGIDVRCEKTSAMNTAATLTFPNAADLTCPITLTASEGFLISTSKSNDAGYQTSLTVSPYKSGSAQAGKLRTIYVRANATGKTENYSGTITISGGEVTEQTITVNANVNCQGYTLTLKDHLGNTIGTPTSHYEGDVIELPTELEEEDPCSENYTFDGWSTSEVKYGSVAYSKVTFSYTMPAKDVTLYPVYRINDTEDYHRVTSDLKDNWAGDYLIAYRPTVFADGRNGGMNEQETMGYVNVKVDLSNYISNDIVSGTIGDTYNVALVPAEGGGYLLQTKDKKYNYFSNNNSNGLNANTMASMALPFAMSIDFISENEINMKLSGDAKGSVFRYSINGDKTYFRFYKNGATSNNPIYLYKKSYLYTSSLICEEITAENAMVTSTAGQTVKVNVTATMSGMTVVRTRELTVGSDNKDFTATITESATNTYNVAVSYTPSAEDNTDGTETATITIEVNDNPVTTFQVTGRHLPENFVIAAKWGDNWYALPANCVNSGDSKQGVLIDVNDINDPTSATAPTTTKYGLRSVMQTRQDVYGQSVLFTERVSGNQKALHQNGEENENIWLYAQYANVTNENATKYEWTPITNDLTNYTFTHTASSRKLGVNNNGVFGAYTTDVQVRLLPATFYEQVAVQVIKWKANSLVVMYTGAETTATTQVGTNTATDAQTLANQKITHGIYELTTTQSLTANAGKILTMCFGAAQVKVEIPLIVGEEVTASANGHDVVILNGGKLTAAETSYSYNNIYVYGGGKLAIPENKSLSVNNIILRAGAVDGVGKDATYRYIYPQVYLKGTLTATSQTFLKYEYVTDYDHWYHLVLPFNANLSTITYPQEYYGENVNADNKGSWVIKRYDGATRATGNYEAWKDIETDNPKATQVIAGKGYIYWGAPKKVTVNGDKQRQKWGIQRITMNKQASTAKTEENSNKKISNLSSYANVPNNSGKDNDQGWNLIGNPYMVNMTGLNSQSLQIGKLIHKEDANDNWTGQWQWDDTSETTGLRYVTIPSDHFDTYTAGKMTETELVAGRSFFVQIAGAATDLVFDVTKKASLMPALLAENNDKPVDIETGIILSNETLQDEMNFWIKDGKTNDYEYNADYPKTPNNTNFNIYGVHAHGDLSWVATGPEYAAESMPIGYQVPAAGTYMLSVSETYYSENLEALYVTDHAMSPEVTVDLMSAPYEFSVNQAETNNERFTVSVILKTEEDDGGGDVGTGVDNTTNSNTPCKFIYQDKMYILLNGVIYDAMGKQVLTINK